MNDETRIPIRITGADSLTGAMLAESLEHGYTISAPHLHLCGSSGAGWRSFEFVGAGDLGAELEIRFELEATATGRRRRFLRIIDGTLEDPLELEVPFYFSDLAALLEAALKRRRDLRPAIIVYRREWTQEDLEVGDCSGEAEEEEHELEADLELEETLESVAAELHEELGATEPSSGPGPIGAGDWFAVADFTVGDYRTGNLEELSAHISGGLSPESVRLELERRGAARQQRRRRDLEKAAGR
jgi:hypothetical protein